MPNVYTVQLSPETYAAFQAISGRLLAELEQYLREFTAERKYQTIGPIAVRFRRKTPEVKTGEMLVTAQNDAGAQAQFRPVAFRTALLSRRAHRHPPADQERTMLISLPPPRWRSPPANASGR